MTLDRIVKIRSVDNLSAARLASGMGVDYLGIDAEALLHEAFLAQVGSIAEWLSGPKLVLEVSENIEKEKVETWLMHLPFDGLEVPATKINEHYSKPVLFFNTSFSGAIDKATEKLYQQSLAREARLLLRVERKSLGALSQALSAYPSLENLSVSTSFDEESLESFCQDFPGLSIELPSDKEEQAGALIGNMADLLEQLELD